MRLIDAEHLKRWILARWENTDPRSAYPLRAIDIIDQIDREDTIETESVVRCKDCKHYSLHCTWNGEKRYWCELDILHDGENGFCSCGAKMDSNDSNDSNALNALEMDEVNDETN